MPNDTHSTSTTKGFLIAGLSGGSGKSVITVGITAALTSLGTTIAPFKKGPDYIDAGWLHLAANSPCYNLDPYLMGPELIYQSCSEHSTGKELIVIEGNRGLFDGVNISGSYSSAELAAILHLPVILVLDCTKMTRTAAALLLGCVAMGTDITIKGVVLNRIGSARHEKIIRQAIEHYTDIAVVGAMPRLTYDIFPQRHIGITPCQEYDGSRDALDDLTALIKEHINLTALVEMAEPFVPSSTPAGIYQQCHNDDGTIVTIGVLKDAAFQFYYPENLTALERCGATLVEINALTDNALPEIDGLYIGGGFPETNVHGLSSNKAFKKSLKEKISRGLPVYAECGGLIYLGDSIEVNGEAYPLTGVFPASFAMQKKPQAHGYTILTATAHNPIYPIGTRITGHEFRYSKVTNWPQESPELALTMERGTGFAEGKDGLVYKNVLALYTHIHALSTPEWAPAFVAKIRQVKLSRDS
nr:cobyrinate a,c-diamide synthase [Desulfobulbaceae bacterium]